MWSYIASGRRLPGMVILSPALIFCASSPFLAVPYLEKNIVLIVELRAVQWTAWLTHTRSIPPTIEVYFRRCRDTVDEFSSPNYIPRGPF